MRRAATVGFAIAAAILVTTAVPAQAATTATGSAHATTNEFEAAATLEDTAVEPGAGGEAYVALNVGAFNVSNTTLLREFDVSGEAAGATGMTWGRNGTRLYIADSSSEAVYQYNVSDRFNSSTATFHDSLDVSGEVDRLRGVEIRPDGTELFIADRNASGGDSRIVSYDLSTPHEVATGTPADTLVVESQDTQPHAIAFNDTGSRIYVSGKQNGNVYSWDLSTVYDLSTATFNEQESIPDDGNPQGLAWGPGGQKLLVTGNNNQALFEYRMGSAWNISTLSGTGTSLSVSGIDTNPQGIDYNAAGTRLSMVGMADDDVTTWGVLGPGSGTYISANHSVTNASQAFTNLSLANASATVSWQNWTGSAWNTVDQTTYTTSGNKTVDISAGAASDKWRVNVTLTNQSANGFATARLHDEGVQFPTHDPTVDNSSASPTGDLTQNSPTLSIDVNDSDFATAQGDEVTVEFFVDNTSVGTDTLTSNGTATQTISGLTGGDHTWHVFANDSYGNAQRSDYFDIRVPTNLTIREEARDYPVIDSARVSFLFFEQNDTDPIIVNRTITDGRVNLTGLPVGSTFVVSIKTAGYYNRTIVIDSIYEQNQTFVINKSVPARRVTFQIDDVTGTFTGEGTEIIIEHAINQSLYASGGYEWLAVAGERKGAIESATFWLTFEDRYRIKIKNANRTRIIGAFTPQFNETVVLRPETADVNVTDEEGYTWNVSTDSVAADTIVFEFFDPENATTDLRVRIYEQGDESNVLQDTTDPGPHGYLRITQLLTNQQSNQTWVVDWNATRNGEEIGGEWVAGKRVEEQIVPLDDRWQHALAVLVVVLTGALFSVRNAEAGAVTTAFVGGGFWMVGWLPTAAGGAIMIALFGAVLWKVRAGGGV